MKKTVSFAILSNMLSINNLKNGLIVLIDDEPYQILEIKHLHMGRGGSSVQTRIKNLKTGQVLQKNFKPADTFEEADIEKKKMIFLYAHRGEYMFAEKETPKNYTEHDEAHPVQTGRRFSLKDTKIEEIKKWLKPNTETEVIFLGGEPLIVSLPIKMDFKVIEAPPALRGNTAEGGTKVATIETGAKISVPLFINENDLIRINTQTGEYTERVTKG